MPFPHTGIFDRRPICILTEVEKKIARRYVQLVACEQKRACNRMFAHPASSIIIATTG